MSHQLTLPIYHTSLKSIDHHILGISHFITYSVCLTLLLLLPSGGPCANYSPAHHAVSPRQSLPQGNQHQHHTMAVAWHGWHAFLTSSPLTAIHVDNTSSPGFLLIGI
ncbi:hypothetical protein BO85DRAFT_278573 [Aspergillus piperis CBS 112811]|uniref:Uncharacterized protein n=1 Tax=Aspergillus piperis CBS 112811 TaxID=1448313 RepID=A0A8G1R3S1_9EURO|nr:hypothetical protein BO85DRAFT_278573 [Aspergillus piperis CBS 112811]RAH58637.1 hypothetical protein BO85DRAFT_278573 [Aspergillus piperis CBS 112811]